MLIKDTAKIFPNLSVNPSSLSFGNVTVNTISGEKTFLIQGSNLSPASANITITVPSTVYQVSLTPGAGFTNSLNIPYTGGVMSAKTIYVRFSPTIVQSYTGNIVTAGGGAANVNTTLTGTGMAALTPTLTINPTALAFGDVTVNTNSNELSYTITGNNLTPAADSLTITAPAGFMLSTVSGSGYGSSKRIAYTGGTLAATRIYVRFSPAAAQNYSGGIANYGGGSAVKTVTLTGNGIPAPIPDLTVNPASLSFGDVTVNTSSGELTYTVTGFNLSPVIDSLTITAPAGFVISNTSGSGYAPVKKIGYTGGTLPTTKIYVRFSPTAVQSYSGSININGGGTTAKSVAVTGTGISAPTPVLTVNPVSLSFGEVIINTSSAERAYTIAASNLSPANDSLAVTAPSGFSISAVSGSGFTQSRKIAYSGGALPATTIYVKFSPTAIQNYSGSIVNTGGGTAAKAVSVAGAGVSLPTPVLTVNTDSLSFEDIIINSTSDEQAFTISGLNLMPAADSITLTAPSGFMLSTISGSNFASSKKIAYTNGTIPMTIVYVRFSPTALQKYTGNIDCSGGDAQIKNITVTGTGINNPSPVITLNPESIDFSSVTINTISSEKIFHIQGSYLSPLIGDITVTAPAGFQVSLTSGYGFTSTLNLSYSDGTLASTNLYVRFSPSDVQIFSGSISIIGAGAPEQNLAVKGTGISATSAALIANPAALSFGGVTINTVSREFSYSLAGSNLMPLNDSLIITAPPGFTVSTVSGSGFSSVKKVAYSSGMLPVPRTIYVRFSPTEARQYSDSITNGGGGAGVMNVHVSGTGLTDLPAPTGTFTASTDTVQSRGDFVTLSWTSANAASASINNGIGQVDVNGTITKSIRSTTKFNLTLTNTTGSTSYTVTVYVKQRKLTDNKALYKPSAASSIELTGSEPNKANDGNVKTRWSSTYVDNQWWQVDFQNVTTVEDVSLIWDESYASEFIISTSLDGLIFTEIATGYASGSDTTSLNFDPINARYIRVTGIERGTKYGISLFEFGAFESASTATSVEEIKYVPDNFCLEQNYPNPFNPATQICYRLSKSADVQLIIYDILGREIIKLVDKRENAGRHTVTFNAKNLSSGIYYARLIAEGKMQIIKMALLR